SSPAPALLDWENQNAPRGWNSWSSNPKSKIGARQKEGRNNSGVAYIGDSQGNASIIQSLTVSAEQRFLVTGWVKGQGSGNITVGYRFQDEKRRWSSNRSQEGSLLLDASETTDWQPVAFHITVPEACTNLILMLGANNQDKEGLAFFDDFVLNKLD
ncbi:MAG: hypothetical protein GX901_02475, partial [Lentisphaerae bacterium]|nr:hypothetical protein [Lentisphaerota bacterium]